MYKIPIFIIQNISYIYWDFLGTEKSRHWNLVYLISSSCNENCFFHMQITCYYVTPLSCTLSIQSLHNRFTYSKHEHMGTQETTLSSSVYCWLGSGYSVWAFWFHCWSAIATLFNCSLLWMSNFKVHMNNLPGCSFELLPCWHMHHRWSLH